MVDGPVRGARLSDRAPQASVDAPVADVADPPGGLAPIPIAPVAPLVAPAPRAATLTRSQVRAAARRRARFGRRLAAAVWKDPFRAVPVDRRLVRFLRGFLLPIGLLRSTLGDRERRRRWFAVAAIQTLVVVTIGGAIGFHATVDQMRSYPFFENGKLTVDAGGVGILVALAYVEWCVIALSRQHHDAIGRDASLAVGVPPEDPARVPRIALDFRWMINKGKRRWRAFKAWLGGVPPIALFAVLPWFGNVAFQVILAAWTIFWIACGTSAKTAYSWRSEGDSSAVEPFFLKSAGRFSEQVPLLRWWLPRLYLRLWRWMTQGLYPPMREVESRGYEFAGLALARVLLGFPVVYLFVRPFFPVAAADIILRDLAAPRGAGARTGRPALPALDRPNDLVVAPASREAAAVVAHQDDRED